MSLQELCCSSHLQRRESTTKLRIRYSRTAIRADKVTVDGLQNMVQENLRGVMRLLQSTEESLPEVVNDRIKCSLWPHQFLHSWQPMGIGNFIQGSLSDKQHQCVEGIWEQNRRLLL